jgi:L-rhamnose mutarotase
MAELLRKAFVLRLKPHSLDVYIDWHNNMWPELRAEIANQGIAQITLFQIDEMVFLYSEIADADAWDRLWNSEIHHRWARELMEPLMHYRNDGIVDSRELPEIWHHEPSGETRS